MGKLIATTQATIDGVIDQDGEWLPPGGVHADYSFERQARSGGPVLGRKTFEGLAAYWPSQTGKGPTWSTRCPSTSGRTPYPEIPSGTRPCSTATSRTRFPR
jgi:hypothetical protein